MRGSRTQVSRCGIERGLPLAAFVLALIMSAWACAQDQVHTVNGRTLIGEVIDAFDLQLSIRAAGTRTVRVPGTEVREVRWAAPEQGESEAALRIETWRSAMRRDRAAPRAEQMVLQLRFLMPAALAAFDTMLVTADPSLRIRLDEASLDFGLDEPLLRALVQLRWWRSRDLLLDLLDLERPAALRLAVYELIEPLLDARAAPALAPLLPSRDRAEDVLPHLFRRLRQLGFEREVWQAVSPFLDAKDLSLRRRAWEAIPGCVPESAAARLKAGMADEDPAVRCGVAHALAASGRDEDFAQLWEMCAQDRQAEVAMAALAALGEAGYGHWFLVPRLIDFAETANQAHTRGLAIRALESLTGARYGEAFEQWRDWWERIGCAATARAAPSLEELEALLDSGYLADQYGAVLGLADRTRELPDSRLLLLLQSPAADGHLRCAALTVLRMRAATDSRLRHRLMVAAIETLANLDIAAASARPEAELQSELPPKLRGQPLLLSGLRQVLPELAGPGVDLGDDLDLWRQWSEILAVPWNSGLQNKLLEELVWSRPDSAKLRQSALALAMRLQLAGMHKFALAEAACTQCPIELRTVAISALGQLSAVTDVEVIALLDQLRQEPNEIVRNAATTALWRLVEVATGGRPPDSLGAWLDAMLER